MLQTSLDLDFAKSYFRAWWIRHFPVRRLWIPVQHAYKMFNRRKCATFEPRLYGVLTLYKLRNRFLSYISNNPLTLKGCWYKPPFLRYRILSSPGIVVHAQHLNPFFRYFFKWFLESPWLDCSEYSKCSYSFVLDPRCLPVVTQNCGRHKPFVSIGDTC